ncbi:MAG: 4-(cytidine 5'-diphospho)-2-C-methyl-D-erythritol kinase [Calditrichia bacterium]
MKVIVEKAGAKINLGLRVVNKRADGYHNLESIFQEVDLFDTLEISQSENGIKFVSNDPELGEGENNLCIRACQVFEEETGIPLHIQIRLEKLIPKGAGLGGGSSDAAACLRALNRFYGAGLRRGDLIRLAARIGSDVPFFVVGGTALVKGRGEVVMPVLHFPKNYRVLLVYPNLHTPTPQIFKKFQLGLTHYPPNVKFEAVICRVEAVKDFKLVFFNDLEKVTKSVYPVVNEIKERLYSVGAEFASMSGSGSVVFGLFEDRVEVSSESMKEAFGDFWVKWVKPI